MMWAIIILMAIIAGFLVKIHAAIERLQEIATKASDLNLKAHNELWCQIESLPFKIQSVLVPDDL